MADQQAFRFEVPWRERFGPKSSPANQITQKEIAKMAFARRTGPVTLAMRGQGPNALFFVDPSGPHAKKHGGGGWMKKRALGRARAKPRRKKAAGRRPRLKRDARGRYLKKGRTSAARRPAPRKRAAARRPRLGRDSRGRFLKRGRRPAAKRRRGGKRLPSMTRSYVARARHRKGVRKHMRARRLIRPGQKIAGLVRINPRTGAITMPRVTVANPRKRRKHHRKSHARRVRNPGTSLMSTAKATIAPMAAGAGAGALAGYLDTKFMASRPTVSVLAKLGLGIAGAALLRRKHPSIAMGFAGGMLGATGYTYGVKFAGGHVALNGIQGLRGLADMAASDPATANLIAGLSDVVPDGMGDATSDYNDALGDQSDGVADIVED